MSTGPEFEVTWEQARQLAHQSASPSASVTLSLHDASGHVLAQDVLALGDMPPFAASRIDGWAVSGPGPWTRVGDALAGHEFVEALAAGECVHIATGAVMPNGATASLKDEESHIDGEMVIAIDGAAGLLDANGALPYFHDVRPSGYEAKTGDVLIPKGTKLTPAIIGVAAAGGHDELAVFKKLVIDVLIFGDELLSSGPSRDGKVRDSLGPQLPLWIDYIGAELNQVKLVADTLEDHFDAISQSKADLIVTTGGTAAGPVDHLHNAIVDAGGSFVIDAVLVRPGYHQILAQLPDKYLIGLPGNPQSAVIGLLTMVRPFLAGSTAQKFPTFERRILDMDILAPEKEHRFVLCREIQAIDEVGLIEPVDYLDSSMLRGFVNATGYAIVEPGGQTKGAIVDWLPLPN
jgi:molybdopterin molybdotransferase